MLLLAYSFLESCLQRKYTLTLPFHLSSKKENLYSYLCLKQPKAWYWLYPFAPSLRTVFSTRRAPSAYSVYHLTLTDRLTSPQPVGEKKQKDFPFEKEHYRKSVVWLHYLKGGRKRFPLYDYATCLPLGKTAFFFAVRQSLKNLLKMINLFSSLYISLLPIPWQEPAGSSVDLDFWEQRGIYRKLARIPDFHIFRNRCRNLLALCRFPMMQLKVWKLENNQEKWWQNSDIWSHLVLNTNY